LLQNHVNVFHLISNAHHTRATNELLEKETPEFISS